MFRQSPLVLFRQRPLRSALQVLAGVLHLAAGISLINFAVAYTPDEAKLVGHTFPPDWSAGVMNHGTFYRWYTVNDAPVLFGFSVIVLILAIGSFIYWTMFERQPSG